MVEEGKGVDFNGIFVEVVCIVAPKSVISEVSHIGSAVEKAVRLLRVVVVGG